TFEYEFGSNKHLRHVPNTRDRGKIYCAYSFVTLPKGGSTFDVMSIDEIELIRKRSASPDKGPWATDWAEMAKKTVFKRLAKGLPLSPKTRDAIEIDNTYEVQEPNIATTRAVVGGNELPAKVKMEYNLETGEISEDPDLSESQNSTPDPEPTMPVGAPTSPPEPVSAAPVSDKPAGPLTRVRKLLKEAG